MSKNVSRRTFLHATPALGVAALTSHSSAEDPQAQQDNPLVSVFPREGSPAPWMMPAHFGGPNWVRPEGVKPGESLYDDVTVISIDYLTDAGKLESYLPRPYELEGPPVVTVAYSMNREISWLAGREYNIISVSTRAAYPGKEHRVTGNYALVLWENLTDPILSGREAQGLPKIYGEIENHRIFDGAWHTSLRRNGTTMLEMHAHDLKQMDPGTFEKFKADQAETTLLGWMYIPNENWSAPMLSYATAFPISYRYREAWTAKGNLEWNRTTFEEIPTQSHIVNALEALPVKEYVSCTVAKTSLTLHSSSVRRLS